MKKLQIAIITLALIGLSNLLNAQAPNWQWAKNSTGGSDFGQSVATDGNGNVVVTGFFLGATITFGSIVLTNSGNWDTYVVKYDISGNVLWANSIGGMGIETGASIATDNTGKILVTGSFDSPTLNFGTTILTNSGGTDMFIVQFDAAGNVLWAKSTGGNSDEYGGSVYVDGNNNVLITGGFNSPTITFGTTTLTNVGSSDIFIVKYDEAGNLLWAKSAGGSSGDNGISITTDNSGNVLVTGEFQSSSIIFGSITLTKIGSADIFVAAYDQSGNVLWAKSAGGSNYDKGYGISVDGIGNVIVTGSFNSPSITFGTTTLTSAGDFDMFIVKYSASGNVMWAKSTGGSLNDESFSVAAEANGNIFVTGSFYSASLIFGTTIINNASGTERNMFIAKYDASGNAIWADGIGGINGDNGSSITADGAGNILVTGSFESPAITFGSTTLTNSGFSEVFLAKLNSTTGLEGKINNIGLAIYPNPATNHLTITLANTNKKVSVAITDITGKIIYKTNELAIQKVEVNTTDFDDGIYFVQVQTREFIETKKLIVAN